MSLYFLKLLWGLVCVAILRAEAELVDVLDYQDYMLNKIVNSEENTTQGELTDAALDFPTMNKPMKLPDGDFTMCFAFYLNGALHGSSSSIRLSLIPTLNWLELFVFVDQCTTDCRIILFSVRNRNLMPAVLHSIGRRTMPIWLYLCVGFDRESGKITYFTDDTTFVETMQNDLFNGSKTFAVGINQWENPGKFGLFNIYKGVKFETCNSSNLGNIYSWDSNDWSIDESHPKFIRNSGVFEPEICSKKKLLSLFSPPRTWDKLNEQIELLKGEIVNFETRVSLLPWVISMFGNDVVKYMWTEKIEDNLSEQNISWCPGYPSDMNAKMVCIACRHNCCVDVECDRKIGALITMNDDTHFVFRGHCKNSNFDHVYKPIMGLNMPLWIGQRGSLIWFDKEKQSWLLHVNKFQTKGLSVSSETQFLLGTTKWKIINNKDCPESTFLSMTTCDQSQFNCMNGFCLLMNKRCDGVLDCMDGSDEIKCTKILKNDTYKKVLSPPELSTNVEVFLNIKKILNINENDGIIRIKYTFSYCWKDSRISFTNIESMGVTSYECEDANYLPRHEADQLWKPRIIIHDIDLINRNTHDPTVHCVVKFDNSSPVYQSPSNMFPEIKPVRVDLSLKLCTGSHYSSTFPCDFNMNLNPFDIQVCNMSITFGAKQTTRINMHDLQYTKEQNVLQYEIFGKFLTIADDNKTATISIVMGRNIGNFLMTTLVPTVTANLLGHCTNFFGDNFELSVGVNLTIMLVITTMLIDIANQFSSTSNFLMIEIWMVVSLLMPFLQVLLQTWLHNLEKKAKGKGKVLPAEKGMFAKKMLEEKEERTSHARLVFLLRMLLKKFLIVAYTIFIIAYLATGISLRNYLLNSLI